MAFSPQTSYTRYFAAAFAGQIGDTSTTRIEGWVNLSGGNVPAGIGVVQDSTDGLPQDERAFKLPGLSTDKLVGVIANTFARNPGDQAQQLSGATDAYLPNETAPLVVEGSVWVTTEGTVNVGDDVYMRYSANGAGKTQLGAFTATAVAGDSSHARKVYGARWLQGVAGAGVALLYVSVAVDRAQV